MKTVEAEDMKFSKQTCIFMEKTNDNKESPQKEAGLQWAGRSATGELYTSDYTGNPCKHHFSIKIKAFLGRCVGAESLRRAAVFPLSTDM